MLLDILAALASFPAIWPYIHEKKMAHFKFWPTRAISVQYNKTEQGSTTKMSKEKAFTIFLSY